MSVLPFGRSGVISASMLGLGRALGETMAVATVLSPSFAHPRHLLDPGGGTFAQNIAAQVRRGRRVRPGRADRLRSGPVRHHPAGQRRGPHDHRPPQGVLGGQRMSNAPSADEAAPSTPAAGASAPQAGPRWAVAAALRRRSAVGIGLGAGLDSKVQWGLIAALLFVVGTYGIAARVEGTPPGQGPPRHQPGLGLLPARRRPAGLPALDDRQARRRRSSTSTSSPTRWACVADTEPGGGIYHAHHRHPGAGRPRHR